MDGRLWIHALLWTDMPQSWIAGWVVEILRGRRGAGVVADEMKVISTRGCDAKRLLHQAIGLVPVAVRAVFLRHVEIRITTTSALGRLASS